MSFVKADRACERVLSAKRASADEVEGLLDVQALLVAEQVLVDLLHEALDHKIKL